MSDLMMLSASGDSTEDENNEDGENNIPLDGGENGGFFSQDDIA
jgi:hypothetical protein